MSKDTWIPMLVGIVILGGLGYLTVTVNSIDSTLHSVNTQVSNTVQRVDRIAAELPALSVRIASEEISRPVQTAIVTTKPFEKPDGAWAIRVHLIHAQLKISYDVLLNDPTDREKAYSIIGLGKELEPYNCSANQLNRWSSEVAEPQFLPHYIDPSATLVFRSVTGDAIRDKMAFLGPGIETPYHYSLANWEALVTIINDHPDAFQPDLEHM